MTRQLSKIPGAFALAGFRRRTARWFCGRTQHRFARLYLGEGNHWRCPVCEVCVWCGPETHQ